MEAERIKGYLMSVYLVIALVTTGVIGLMIFEGVVDEGGVEAALIVDQNGGGGYTTINAALAVAGPGSTIYVWEGTYNETLLIRDSVSLIGNGTSNTTIVALKDKPIMGISASGTLVTGFNLTVNNGSSAAIISIGATSVGIKNNYIYVNKSAHATYGIFSGADGVLVEGNTFYGNITTTLYLYNADSVRVLGNTFIGVGRAITFMSMKVNNQYNLIDGNIVNDSKEGIYIYSGWRDRFINNNISVRESAIIVYEGREHTFYNNSMSSQGFRLEGDERYIERFDSHTIDISNTVNGKPVYYWRNFTGKSIPSDAGQVIIVNCTNIYVENIGFEKVAYGVRVLYSEKVKIKNCSFNGGSHSQIDLAYADECTIFNNTFSNNYRVLHFFVSDYNIVNYNTLKTNSDYPNDMIEIENSDYNNFSYNYGERNPGRFYLFESHYTVVYGNTFLSETFLNFEESDYCTVNNNTFNSTEENGIKMWRSNDAKLKNNICSLNNLSGINIASSYRNTLINNVCDSNNASGVSTYNALYAHLEKNKFRSNKLNGIFLQADTTWGTYQDNICSFNSFDGINLSDDGSWRPRDNTFDHNNLSNNNNGITFNSAWSDLTGNELFDNVISSNSNTGVFLSANCFDNVFYHNNFVSNGKQVELTETNTWWDTVNLEGNYWSDYTGADDGSGTGKHAVSGDGIGDTKLPHLSLDSYPMMNYFGWRMPGTPKLDQETSIDTDGNYRLNWSQTFKTTAYILEEDTSNGFDNPKIIYDGGSLNFTVTGRGNGTYFYRVKAYNKYLPGSWSNIVSVAVDPVPRKPIGLTVKKVTAHEVELGWMLNTEPDIQGYRILMNATDTGPSGPFLSINTVSSIINDYTVTDLDKDITYYFVLQAYDKLSHSSYSNMVNATTLDPEPPSPPSGLAAEALSNYEIKLSWNANLEFDIEGYIIFMNNTNEGPDGNYHVVKTVAHSQLSYTVSGLAEQTTYHFKLKAFDEVPNNSSFSNVTSETTPDLIPPCKPTGLTVSDAKENSLTLTWNPNGDHDVRGYLLYSAPSITGKFEPLNKVLIKNTTYEHINLGAETEYYYKLTAVDDVDLESDFSEIAIGKTLEKQYYPDINSPQVNFSMPEDTYDDTTINVKRWFIDTQGNPLSFECKGQANIDIKIFPVNGTVTLKPKFNWNGAETLRFFATNIQGNSINDTVTVTVTPMNDPPSSAEIKSPKDGTEVEKGDSITFEGSAEDADEDYGDTLTFKWSSDIDGDLGEGITLENIVLTPGEHTITLEVIDKENKITTKTITIKVREGDEPGPGPGEPGSSETSEKAKEKDEFDYLPILLVIIIVVIILIAAFIILKKRRKDKSEVQSPESGVEAPTPRFQETREPVVEPGTIVPTEPVLESGSSEPSESVGEPGPPEPPEPVVEPRTIEPAEPVPIVAPTELPKTRPVPEGSTARRLEELENERFVD